MPTSQNGRGPAEQAQKSGRLRGVYLTRSLQALYIATPSEYDLPLVASCPILDAIHDVQTRPGNMVIRGGNAMGQKFFGIAELLAKKALPVGRGEPFIWEVRALT